MEVAARAQAGALFEERAEKLLGRARGDRGLQDDRGVRAQPRGQGAGGLLDLGEVERAVGAQGRRGADDRRTDAAEFGGAGGGLEAAGEHAAQFAGGEGAGVGAGAVTERGDLRLRRRPGPAAAPIGRVR